MNLTFLMPCRIESEDRLKNVITSISYLLYHFPECKIIVKEHDIQSIFEEKALPYITQFFGKKTRKFNSYF